MQSILHTSDKKTKLKLKNKIPKPKNQNPTPKKNNREPNQVIPWPCWKVSIAHPQKACNARRELPGMADVPFNI